MRYQPYRLTGKHSKYAQTGKVPEGARERDQRQKVEEKVKLLPERFNSLFSDIEALHDHGFLDTETWFDDWLRLLDVDKSQPPHEQFGYKEPETFREKPALEQFGYDMGKCIQQIHAFDTPFADHEEMLQNILWGVMNAFSDSVAQVEGDRHEKWRFVQETLEEFNHRTELEKETSAQIREAYQEARTEEKEQSEQPITDITGENTPEQKLTRHLQNDARQLAEVGHKPTGFEILEVVANRTGGISSFNVAKGINGNKDWTGRVTKWARSPLATPTEKYDFWKPLLTGDKRSWDTTTYGQALYHFIVENYSNPTQFADSKEHNGEFEMTFTGISNPLAAVPDELLDELLDSVDTET